MADNQQTTPPADEEKPAAKSEKSTTRLKAPKGVTAASAAGSEYVVVKGHIEAQPAHVAALREHGFQPVDEG